MTDTSFIEGVKSTRDTAANEQKQILEVFKKQIAKQAKYGSSILYFDITNMYADICGAVHNYNISYMELGHHLYRLLIDLEKEGFKVSANYESHFLNVIVEW